MRIVAWKNYVPVLKWERAERKAIRELSSLQKELILPIFQLMPPKMADSALISSQTGAERRLKIHKSKLVTESQKTAAEISTDWGFGRALLDNGLLYSPEQRLMAVAQVLENAPQFGLTLTPVVNVSADDDELKRISALTKKFGDGICLRLSRGHFAITAGELSHLLHDRLTKSGFSPKDVDIVIDMQVVDESDPDYHSIMIASQLLPNLNEWRSLVVIAGSFPKDLTKCTVDNENYCPRTDWENWQRYTQSRILRRIPCYGDYTIQHPIFNNQTQFFPPSKSIKYTLDNSWLIMRGTKKGPTNQYLGHAQLLSRDDHYKNMYSGRSFSFGDAYIYSMGDDIQGKKTGNAETWLAAGINHHVARTVTQISKLT